MKIDDYVPCCRHYPRRYFVAPFVARTLALALLLSAGLGGARRASAESAAPQPVNTEAARKHFEAGKRHYLAGTYAAAIEQFKAAQAIHASPILDYNIALCYERLGQPKDALPFYRSYLRGSPNADNRAATETRIQQLEAQTGETASGAGASAGAAPDGAQSTNPAGASADARGRGAPSGSSRGEREGSRAAGRPSGAPPQEARTYAPQNPPTFVFGSQPQPSAAPQESYPPPSYDLQTPWYATGAINSDGYGENGVPLRRVALSLALNAATNLSLNDVATLSGRVADVGVGAAFALSVLTFPAQRIGFRFHASTAVFGQGNSSVGTGKTTTTFLGAGAFMEIPLARDFPLFITPMAAFGVGVLSFTSDLADRIESVGGKRSYVSAAMRFEIALKYIFADRHGVFLTPVGLNIFFPPGSEGRTPNSVLGFDRDNYTYDVLFGYELRL